MFAGLPDREVEIRLDLHQLPDRAVGDQGLDLAICAWNGNANASQSRVPVRRAASSTRSVSGSTPQSGFSHRVGLPASSARIVHSACSALGSGM